MMVYAVVTSHKTTKSEYVDALFIHEDNALDYMEFLQLELITTGNDKDYEVHLEPMAIKDWEEDDISKEEMQ